MKLRTKVLLILAGMWVIVCTLVYVASTVTLSARFRQMETSQVQANLVRSGDAIKNLQRALSLLSHNWGQWDELYDFMFTQKPKFIHDNMEAPAFDNAKINLIFIYDTHGKLYYGRYYDINKKTFIPIPANLVATLHDANVLRGVDLNHPVRTGMVNTPQGYLVFAISAVLKSNGSGPVDGSILMGYFIQPSHIADLAATLHFPLVLHAFPLPQGDLVLHNALQNLIQGHPVDVISANKKMITGYALLNDINGKPIAMYSLSAPRLLYEEGMATVKYFLSIIVGLAILELLSLWHLLKYFVLNRLLRVSRQVIDIKQSCEFNQRVSVDGRDELAKMVGALNSLLEIIELTQEQLQARIEQRTEKLAHLSQLNSNLFQEVNQQRMTEVNFRKTEKQLHQLAYYDILTGLPNRMFFNELCKKAIQKASAVGAGLTLMLIDTSNFKQLNDTYGHALGDRYLEYVAQNLKKVIKDADLVARYVSSNFVIFLDGVCEKAVIDAVAEKILKVISVPMVMNDVQITSTFAIGISLYPANGKTIEELEEAADLALYYARQQQGSAFVYAGVLEKSITSGSAT